jgi:hypothetical protein
MEACIPFFILGGLAVMVLVFTKPRVDKEDIDNWPPPTPPIF